MKVIVIGLGSMGKRRIRLMRQMDSDIEIIGVDSRKDRREELADSFGIKTYDTLDEAVVEGVDCAFVCTSPLSHSNIISGCLNYGLHTFTEINLVSDKYEENMALAEEKKRVLFLSSTFLYRKEIQYIEDAVNHAHSLLTYSYHVGQYLPDWHPWEKYTDYFISDNRTNGCRELMAIEFPWIHQVFGEIVDIHVRKGRKTGLNINYSDSYVLSVEHKNGTQGTIMLDVVSRKAVRNLEIFGEDLYLSWDGSANGLRKYNFEDRREETVQLYEKVNRQSGYAEYIVENAYLDEIKAFFEEIHNGKKARYGFREDRYTLALIDKVE
ncbi:MAG: Gfo/Idh/MocA family oxidoreductase [Lachnospiraceae bacterium]|nr:Gfo/Idh/MocA family oxidoreductase [Lachnospiraceae bacterium]